MTSSSSPPADRPTSPVFPPGRTPCPVCPVSGLRASFPTQSVRMYEPQAADLLMKLGLSVAEGKSASPEGSPEGAPEGGAARTVPVEGVQALSAAMSLIGGDSGVSADVRLGVFVGFCARA